MNVLPSVARQISFDIFFDGRMALGGEGVTQIADRRMAMTMDRVTPSAPRGGPLEAVTDLYDVVSLTHRFSSSFPCSQSEHSTFDNQARGFPKPMGCKAANLIHCPAPPSTNVLSSGLMSLTIAG
jgi:hypothetical protein